MPTRVIIDTNVWIEIWRVFEELKNKISYSDMWKVVESGSWKSGLDKATIDRLQKGVDLAKQLLEIGKEIKLEIHVPKYVYNEVGFQMSSKMTKNPKNELTTTTFGEFLTSIPEMFDKVFDPHEKKLNIGTDYPNKAEEGTDIRTKMETFLEENRNTNKDLKDILTYLSRADDKMKKDVNRRTESLKNIFNDVNTKLREWDKQMSSAMMLQEIPKKTRTELLNPLNEKVGGYFKTEIIPFEKPYTVLAQRLTMKKEELDFFDLKIYMYAKEKGCHVFTMNTQAFQEINDPHFLGYFEDIKILNPDINCRTTEDVRIVKDFYQTVVDSMKKDFQDDILKLNEIDKKLKSPLLKPTAEKAFESIKSEYFDKLNKPKTGKAFNFKEILDKVPLAKAMKLLRIEEKKLKVSREELFSKSSATDIKTQTAVIRYVNDIFFERMMNIDDLVKEKKSHNFKKLDLETFLKSQRVRINIIPSNENNNLENFFKNINKEDIGNYFLTLHIETFYEKKDIEKEWNLAPINCNLRKASTGGARKREAIRCLFGWEDVDKFNKNNKHNRDVDKIEIDSDKFYRYLKTVKDPIKRQQLIQFADKVIHSGEYETKLTGSRVNEISQLINHRKISNHFSRLNHISTALGHGMFAKDLLGDLLEGDIKGVAINLGFISASFGFSKLAELSFARGVRLAGSGKVILGNGLKIASPFIGRLVSPLIIYDLFQQIAALKQGDKDAIVGIVGDGIFLLIDTIEIGVALLETAGLISGISAMTGPVGLAIGVVVFIGTDVYYAVREVDKIDELIHLTGGERWRIGWDLFWHVGLPLYIKKLVEIKSANNKLAEEGLKFLKNNTEIIRYVHPSASRISSETIILENDNQFGPNINSNIKWDRARPDNPAGGRIFCAPQGNWETPQEDIIYKCKNAIGIQDTGSKSNNYTFISLGDGNDDIEGFVDGPNIYVIGGGMKNIRGSKGDDVFIIDRNLGSMEKLPKGIIDGMAGSNMLDLGRISDNLDIKVTFSNEPKGPKLEFRKSYILNGRYYWSGLELHNITSIIGRERASDEVHSICSTKYINGKGGNSLHSDIISITDDVPGCNHEKTINIGPYTVLKNSAVSGKFLYVINDVYSSINWRLNKPPTKNIPIIENEKHIFNLNCTLFDINNIKFVHSATNYFDISIEFSFKKISKYYTTSLSVSLGSPEKVQRRVDNIILILRDNIQLRLHNDGIYALVKSNKTVESAIETYRPIGNKLGLSIFIHSDLENATIAIGGNSKHDILQNDPHTKSHLVGNKGNNTYIISSRQVGFFDVDSVKVPDIVIHTVKGTDEIETLDLRPLTQEIKNYLGKDLLIKPAFAYDKMVLFLYIAEDYTVCTRPSCSIYSNVTTITFFPERVRLWEEWCSRLHVILNNAPLLLECRKAYRQPLYQNVISTVRDVLHYDPANYYTPIPLVFPEDIYIIVISANDVDPHNEVIVKQFLGKYRYLRNENDLLLTNGFDITKPNNQASSIIMKDFFLNPEVFYTLTFKFKDQTIPLKEEMTINIARNLTDVYEEYHENIDLLATYDSNSDVRSKRDLEEMGGSNNAYSSTQAGTGNTLHSWFEFVNKPLHYLANYFISTSKLLQDGNQHYPRGYEPQKEYLFSIEQKIEPGSKEQISRIGNMNTPDINGTLLLLDLIIRKLNDSRFKPLKEYNISPLQEQIKNNITQLTDKMGWDEKDVVGSMKSKHRKLLGKLPDR